MPGSFIFFEKVCQLSPLQYIQKHMLDLPVVCECPSSVLFIIRVLYMYEHCLKEMGTLFSY